MNLKKISPSLQMTLLCGLFCLTLAGWCERNKAGRRSPKKGNNANPKQLDGEQGSSSQTQSKTPTQPDQPSSHTGRPESEQSEASESSEAPNQSEDPETPKQSEDPETPKQSEQKGSPHQPHPRPPVIPPPASSAISRELIKKLKGDQPFGVTLGEALELLDSDSKLTVGMVVTQVKNVVSYASCSPEMLLNITAGLGNKFSDAEVVTILQFLLKRGAQASINKEYRQELPLHQAVSRGRLAVVKCLIEQGGASPEKQESNGYTALHSAIMAANLNHSKLAHYLNIVRYLIRQKPALIELKDNTNYTALLWGANHGELDVVKILVEEGKADLKAKSNTGKTALTIAKERNHQAVIKYLQSKGATG